MSRPILNCADPNWRSQLSEYVRTQREVDLINFDYDTHGKICEELARKYSMAILLDRNPAARTLQFRKKEKRA